MGIDASYVAGVRILLMFVMLQIICLHFYICVDVSCQTTLQKDAD